VTSNKRISVFGAYGHTGRFVVAELLKRGLMPILCGRDRDRLEAVSNAHRGLELRVATLADPDSLSVAIAGSSAVVNCAGPFLDTASPIVDAAIRLRIPYLDIAAEQAAVLNVFERFDTHAKAAGIVVVPAMAFYGGLGDLMATAAMDDWDFVDEICIAVGLDSWKPTQGTRLTGARNPGKRFIFSNNTLQRADAPLGRRWDFPAPFGEQEVVSLSMAETITISHHLKTPEIRVFMNLAPLTDLRNPDTPPPTPADASGRSAQIFLMDVIVRRGDDYRRVVAKGQDIYAITAPIVAEATERVINGQARTLGVGGAGEVFDAFDFLRSLQPFAQIEMQGRGWKAPSSLAAAIQRTDR